MEQKSILPVNSLLNLLSLRCSFFCPCRLLSPEGRIAAVASLLAGYSIVGSRKMKNLLPHPLGPLSGKTAAAICFPQRLVLCAVKMLYFSRLCFIDKAEILV